MNRRSFIGAGLKQFRNTDQVSTSSGLNKYSGVWTANEAQHLCKRVFFGSTKKDIEYFTSIGLTASLDAILNYGTPLPSPPVNDYNATYNDPNVTPGSAWVNDPSMDPFIHLHRRRSLKRWWMGLMITQESTIREKMTLFWVNFFGTQIDQVINANMSYQHNNLLRQNAVGNFRQIVKGVTKDAAMLHFLNGYLNFASAPDENYARELQELFTLGKGAAVQYTEEDVRAAARVLTGWRIDNSKNFSSYFDPLKHDTQPKVFSAYYGNKTIAGKTGLAGAEETDELIDMIFGKEEVSLYLCRRIYRWFVYYEIDQEVETNVIVPLAKILRDSNYEVKPVLRALLESEHFFDVLNQNCLIKSPVEHMVSLLREFSVIFPSDYVVRYKIWHNLVVRCGDMGQDIGDPPDVSGWPAYYQTPQFHELWINSDTLPKREQFCELMLNNGVIESGQKIVVDVLAVVKTFKAPGDPNKLIDELLQIIYRVPLSAQAKQTIKQQILLSNQAQDAYWTEAWNAYASNPSAANQDIVSNRLKTLFLYFLSLPEYQLS